MGCHRSRCVLTKQEPYAERKTKTLRRSSITSSLTRETVSSSGTKRTGSRYASAVITPRPPVKTEALATQPQNALTSKTKRAPQGVCTPNRAVKKSPRKTWGTARKSKFLDWQIGQGGVSPGLGFGGFKRFGSRKGLKTRHCRIRPWFGVASLLCPMSRPVSIFRRVQSKKQFAERPFSFKKIVPER